MQSLDEARELAHRMVALGQAAGVRAVALLADMNTPLGLTVGSALGAREAVEVLAGGGFADVVELTLALAGEMVQLAGLDADPAEVLASGQAMDVWRRMISAQGGDLAAAPPDGKAYRRADRSGRPGVITSLDAMAIGVASWRLGAGRARKEDTVQAGAGIELLARSR